MFSIKWNKRDHEMSGRVGTIYKERKDAEPIVVCKVVSWGLGSCAVALLQNWGWCCRLDKADLDAFFEFVCLKVDADWQPQEFYFMLSDCQIRHQGFENLVEHPNVKLRDKFANKSHGPNKVLLYRYSKAKDFKRFVQRKGKL